MNMLGWANSKLYQVNRFSFENYYYRIEQHWIISPSAIFTTLYSKLYICKGTQTMLCLAKSIKLSITNRVSTFQLWFHQKWMNFCNCTSFFLNIEMLSIWNHTSFFENMNQTFQNCYINDWLRTMDSSNEWCANNWITSNISGRETAKVNSVCVCVCFCVSFTYRRAADEWFTSPLFICGWLWLFHWFIIGSHWWCSSSFQSIACHSSGFDFSFSLFCCCWHDSSLCFDCLNKLNSFIFVAIVVVVICSFESISVLKRRIRRSLENSSQNSRFCLLRHSNDVRIC